jgi:hypothetical protein
VMDIRLLQLLYDSDDQWTDELKLGRSKSDVHQSKSDTP